MDPKIKEAIFRQVAAEPFAKKFGLKLVDLAEGYSKVEMVFTPDMANMFGAAHGGALFALIDEAFETASNSHGTLDSRDCDRGPELFLGDIPGAAADFRLFDHAGPGGGLEFEHHLPRLAGAGNHAHGRSPGVQPHPPRRRIRDSGACPGRPTHRLLPGAGLSEGNPLAFSLKDGRREKARKD